MSAPAFLLISSDGTSPDQTVTCVRAIFLFPTFPALEMKLAGVMPSFGGTVARHLLHIHTESMESEVLDLHQKHSCYSIRLLVSFCGHLYRSARFQPDRFLLTVPHKFV